MKIKWLGFAVQIPFLSFITCTVLFVFLIFMSCVVAVNSSANRII